MGPIWAFDYDIWPTSIWPKPKCETSEFEPQKQRAFVERRRLKQGKLCLHFGSRNTATVLRRLHFADLSHLFISGNMTTSKRLADRKVERFEKNVTRRGAVPETTSKKGSDYPVGPMVLGLFVFVVIGSSLFQIIRTATSGGMA